MKDKTFKEVVINGHTVDSASVIRTAIQGFHNNKINIDQLENILYKANPHSKDEREYSFYNDWIRDNIEGYKAGEEYLLSLTSSGSIYNNLEGLEELGDEPKENIMEDKVKKIIENTFKEVADSEKPKIEKKKVEPIAEAEVSDTSSKADATFKTLEDVLLDLRNAESKLVMGISYDMSSIFGSDLDAIKKVIENASASVENLAKKMHQQLLQEGKPNQSSADKFGDWFQTLDK